MERSLRQAKDKETNSIFDFIFNNAFGNPIKLQAAPTLAQMKGNTWGYFGTTLFIKFSDGTGITIVGGTLS